MAESGAYRSAGFEWYRADLTGALDWNGTERFDWSAGLEWHRTGLKNKIPSIRQILKKWEYNAANYHNLKDVNKAYVSVNRVISIIFPSGFSCS